jgi:hypothetical protein
VYLPGRIEFLAGYARSLGDPSSACTWLGSLSQKSLSHETAFELEAEVVVDARAAIAQGSQD